MVYNGIMEKTKIKTAIIGGGASGLILAASLTQKGEDILVLERNDRVGKKLSATGNGQGNITNLAVTQTEYFSSSPAGGARAHTIINDFDDKSLSAFFERLGVPLIADERGREYPAGWQASALTDALRFYIAGKGVRVQTNARVNAIKKQGEKWEITAESGVFEAETVVLCTGGKAAKNFGTDGSAYALATAFGHTVTPLTPSLVQLKTDTVHTKTLKGIRAADAGLTAVWTEKGKTQKTELTGDIIFTDYGVSGDAVFRISAFITDKLSSAVTLYIDFLPNFTEERLFTLLTEKRKTFKELPQNELLGGVLNNQIGRAVLKRANGDIKEAVKLLKAFPLQVTGTLGFDYAQVTKGGIPLNEADGNLQSKYAKGLYFAGEILDIDGQCGGFNLQWAYSSARTVAKAIEEKAGGQVCV